MLEFEDGTVEYVHGEIGGSVQASGEIARAELQFRAFNRSYRSFGRETITLYRQEFLGGVEFEVAIIAILIG